MRLRSLSNNMQSFDGVAPRSIGFANHWGNALMPGRMVVSSGIMRISHMSVSSAELRLWSYLPPGGVWGKIWRRCFHRDAYDDDNVVQGLFPSYGANPEFFF